MEPLTEQFRVVERQVCCKKTRLKKLHSSDEDLGANAASRMSISSLVTLSIIEAAIINDLREELFFWILKEYVTYFLSALYASKTMRIEIVRMRKLSHEARFALFRGMGYPLPADCGRNVL
jgi:hypothetical protein